MELSNMFINEKGILVKWGFYEWKEIFGVEGSGKSLYWLYRSLKKGGENV